VTQRHATPPCAVSCCGAAMNFFVQYLVVACCDVEALKSSGAGKQYSHYKVNQSSQHPVLTSHHTVTPILTSHHTVTPVLTSNHSVTPVLTSNHSVTPVLLRTSSELYITSLFRTLTQSYITTVRKSHHPSYPRHIFVVRVIRHLGCKVDLGYSGYYVY
jgi:hypothetical protein